MDTMERLTVLDLSEAALKELPSSIDNLIGIKYLRMKNYKNLVCLPDSFSKLKSLKRFDLEGSLRLEIFPEVMDTMEELYELDLSGTALKELPSSIDNLIGLQYLRMKNCNNLVCLPDSFYKLKSLKTFDLEGCSRLEIFPEVMDTMEELYELDLRGTALKELPSSIDNLIGLQYLSLKDCENLVCLPDSFYKLKSLETFDLEGCSRLEIFPEVMDTMEELYELDLSRTALKELPSSVGNLIGLEYLRMKNCKNLVCLPDSFYKLKSLKTFDLEGCSRLEIFPEVMDTMEELYELDLSRTSLKELPSSIGNLIGLKGLRLKYCENFICLPDNLYKLKSLMTFHLCGCSRLEIFPEVMDTMGELYDLDLSGTALKELPSSIGNLIGLKYLRMKNCKNLVCLRDGFYKLKSLKTFNLEGCSRLEIFPEVMNTMEELYELDLSGTALKELPSSIDNLIGLKELRFKNCENIVCLPDSFYKFKSLLCLSLCGCSNLVVKNLFTSVGGRPVNQKDLHGLSSLNKLDLSKSNLENFPTTIKQFPCLEELIMRKCKRLKSLPELPPSLVYLDADDCTSLEDVSSIKKHFEQALFCEDGSNRWLKLIFTNCFQLNENCTENDTSVEEVSSIKKLLKQAVFCKSLGWLFTNCFQLDQKAVSSAETPKLEMPFEQLVTVLKDYHQARPESKKGTRIVTCVPGSEIPEWFDFKSLGSSINIQLPSEWCSNNSRINFPSFVASVVVSFPDSYNGKELGIRCKCHLKSCNDDSHYLSCYASIGFKSGLSDKLLDHLFLLYGGEEVRGFVKSEASNERFYNEASFSFYLDDGETLHKWIWSECKVKQCGVHLLFAN
ncbi:disease resistance protein RPV1 [Gossypium hirsutum]|uniref:Disease resistance protein RPV1 n=1 Tax=Gossypium hirsutum TaxID=3635 RepID=A0A1U8HJV9_GOSHI|nr:disease resistance protein RPV1 [Gossypium hirsutum]